MSIHTCFKWQYLIVIFTAFVPADLKVFDRCELAHYVLDQGLVKNDWETDLPKWMCIANKTGFDTSFKVISDKNDPNWRMNHYGVFAIRSFVCSENCSRVEGSFCKSHCFDMLEDDLQETISCANDMSVWFNHWREWDRFAPECLDETRDWSHLLDGCERNVKVLPGRTLVLNECQTNARITCAAEGYPLPNITIEGRYIGEEPDRISLDFESNEGRITASINFKVVLEKDSGQYTCKAENGVSNATSIIHLIVQPQQEDERKGCPTASYKLFNSRPNLHPTTNDYLSDTENENPAVSSRFCSTTPTTTETSDSTTATTDLETTTERLTTEANTSKSDTSASTRLTSTSYSTPTTAETTATETTLDSSMTTGRTTQVTTEVALSSTPIVETTMETGNNTTRLPSTNTPVNETTQTITYTTAQTTLIPLTSSPLPTAKTTMIMPNTLMGSIAWVLGLIAVSFVSAAAMYLFTRKRRSANGSAKSDGSYPLFGIFLRKSFICESSRIEVYTSNVLGVGAFGTVYRGQFDGATKAAVKTISITGTMYDLKSLLLEAKILSELGRHPNVVKLLGVDISSLNHGVAYIALEFCEHGSLKQLLDQQRDLMQTKSSHVYREGVYLPGYIQVDLVSPNFYRTNQSIKSLSEDQMLSFTLDVCKGMEFLAANKVVHSDLAARNVLLDQNWGAKLTDFGLSHHLYKTYVNADKATLLPWRWLPVETLKHLKLSEASDVWSFGVLMWEIYSFGEIPYTCGVDFSNGFVSFLEQGMRLPKPAHANEETYQVMLKCWEMNPTDRPRFSSLLHLLDKDKGIRQDEKEEYMFFSEF